MSERFEVGEVAIIRRATSIPHVLGHECTIVSELGHYLGDEGCLVYKIEIEGVAPPPGRYWLAEPDDLRKKPRQRDNQVTTWAATLFQPQLETSKN